MASDAASLSTTVHHDGTVVTGPGTCGSAVPHSGGFKPLSFRWPAGEKNARMRCKTTIFIVASIGSSSEYNFNA